ncbi:MAG TPA: fused MFS/spermidine synthase [Candidatus Brocadiia bacterium]|nr:fused MFS/spermidine synthase [Candidatus Brocadiales bacterium]
MEKSRLRPEPFGSELRVELLSQRLAHISSLVLVGGYATIAQVLLIREFLVVFYGNELCLGIIFGSWLSGVALGAAVAGRISGRFESALSGLTWFILTFVAMCFVFPSQIILVRLLRGILNIPPGQYIPILTLLYSSAIIIVPFSFAIGFIFPFACKIFKGATSDEAADIGMVYIIEAIGSLVGGVLFTFVIVSKFHPFETIAILNCVVFVNLLTFSRTNKFVRATLLVFFFVSLSLLLSRNICKIEDYLVHKRWNYFNPNIALVESVDSRYGNIVVGSQGEQYVVYGNGQYAFAFPNEYEYAPLAHLVLTEHPHPKRVLLISGGVGGLIREMLKHSCIEELHYVELDPKLLEITEKYLPVQDRVALLDKRVKVFHVDGRYFIKQSMGKKPYDVIFVNVPDPSTASLNRFYTREFFKEAKDILAENGVFAASISSAGTYIGEDVGSYTGSIYHTLHNVFRYVVVTPGEINYYFSSDAPGVVTNDIDTLAQRYRERKIESPYFSEYHYQTLLPPVHVQYIESKLSDRKNIRINTDSKPVTYYFNLMLWDRFSGGQLYSVFHGFKDVGLGFFLLPIVGFLALRLGYAAITGLKTRRGKRRLPFISTGECHSPLLLTRWVENQQRFNSLTAIATTGFAGIAVEIILIFAFQNMYGYVFERIGLIVALFMLGLALGGYITNRLLLIGQRNWIKILLYLETFVVIYVLTLPFLLRLFSLGFVGSESLFMILVVTAGMLTGLVFPIASKLYLLSSGSHGLTAGMVDSTDHAGAFIGAITTGVLFVPLLGITGACTITAALNAASAVLLLAAILWKKQARF